MLQIAMKYARLGPGVGDRHSELQGCAPFLVKTVTESWTHTLVRTHHTVNTKSEPNKLCVLVNDNVSMAVPRPVGVSPGWEAMRRIGTIVTHAKPSACCPDSTMV